MDILSLLPKHAVIMPIDSNEFLHKHDRLLIDVT